MEVVVKDVLILIKINMITYHTAKSPQTTPLDHTWQWHTVQGSKR